MFTLTSISALIFLATMVNTFTAYVAWQRRKTRGGIYFALAMIALALWSMASGLDYAATSVPLKIFFAKLEYATYFPALSLMAAFSITYAGYENWLKKASVNAFLFLIPILGILLAWTNELHTWLWTDFIPSGQGINVVDFKHGPAFLWVSFSGYLLVIIVALNFLQVAMTGSSLLRRQSRLILIALAVPVASNLLYIFKVLNFPGLDWSSVTFSLTGVLFLIALYGSRFMEIVPTARNAMIDHMNDGVLVVDDHGRLVDFNPAAQAICKVSQQDLWKPFQQTPLKNFPEIVALLSDPMGRTSQDIIISPKSYNIQRIPLSDHKDRVYGHLAVLHDNTELHAAQEKLGEQKRAFAVIEERQRLARDLHDSVSQSLHSLNLFSETLIAALGKGNVDRTQQLAERLQESARQALKETRLMLYQLQPSENEAEMNLIDEIEARLSSVEERSGVRASLVVEGDADGCPEVWRKNLVGITIEALNNSLKHAQARNAMITLRCDASKVEVEIADDGIGFDPHRVRSGGMGLRSMHERARLLGGTLEIRSALQAGTCVIVRVEKKEAS